MKTHTLRLALVIGFLACGGRTAISQQLSTSAPIIINLSEIDRYGVSVWSLPKPMDGARLILPYRDMKQSELDALVRVGLILHRSVWIVDGSRVIAKCSLIGESEHHPDSKSNTEYGLLLGFDSAEEAQKIRAIVELEPSADELISLHMNDQRLWIF